MSPRHTYFLEAYLSFLIIFCTGLPNELRIDAARRGKVKRKEASAAASMRVELSRTLETTNQLENKAQV